ncbi:MAG: hypothetical protein OQL08_10885 [Gammaproteobacteria bacterium]|nr:hypothetical protein [Gammaproteobacteria bacterium]
MREIKIIKPRGALEMTMRDVLGNMEELAGEYGLRDMGGEFEILAIEPASDHGGEATGHTPPAGAVVIPFSTAARRVA